MHSHRNGVTTDIVGVNKHSILFLFIPLQKKSPDFFDHKPSTLAHLGESIPAFTLEKF